MAIEDTCFTLGACFAGIYLVALSVIGWSYVSERRLRNFGSHRICSTSALAPCALRAQSPAVKSGMNIKIEDRY